MFKHVPIIALVAATSVWLSLRPAPLSSAEQADRVASAPSAEEVLLLEEVAAWSGEAAPFAEVSPAHSAAGEIDLPFADHVSFAESVLARQDSFDHFIALSAESPASLEDVPFGELIGPIARRHQVDPLLVASVIEAESSFNPAAVSPVGAIGLMQVMPVTARDLGSNDPEEIGSPRTNVEIGTRYLARLLRRFDGNVALAVAAYNAGPGAVARFGGLPPFPETQHYVERVLARYVSHLRDAMPSGKGSQLADLTLGRS